MTGRGYGTVREYRDDPGLIYTDEPAPRRGNGVGGGSETSEYLFQNILRVF